MSHKFSYFYFVLFFIMLSQVNHIAYAKQTEKKAVIPELPIKYFSKTSQNRNIIISPDGKHLAVILRIKDKVAFAILETETMKSQAVIGVRGAGNSVGDVYWANNSRIIYSIYETSQYDQQHNHTGELYGVNIDGGQHDIIFGYRAGQSTTGSHIKKRKASYASQQILDILKDDNKNILIAYYPWAVVNGYWQYTDTTKPIIKKLNVYTGRMSTVGRLPFGGADAIVDNNGNVRFAIGTDKNDNRLVAYKENKDSDWQDFPLKEFDGTDFNPLSFSEDNKNVYFTASEGGGTRGLYQLKLSNHSIKKLYQNDIVDLNQIVYDFPHRRVIYVGIELGKPEYFYIEPKNKKSRLHKVFRKSFPDQDILITSSTTDGSKLIFLAYADTNPGDYYLFDTKTKAAKYLMSKNSWVNPDYLRPTKAVSFTTRDNQKIYGYLTLPQKNGSSLLPMVVYPHGGPHGVRDYWQYQWDVQLLANRGYVVLQVNYRGSGGFGKNFESEGFGKWGTLMQDDITDATKAIINQKIADPKRICIYGASYGAYAALMGTVREPDLYQCAIGSAGVYDLPMMLKKGDIPNRLKNGLAFLKKAVGNNIADLKSRSPVYNADKIKAAILLIHGAKDERAPISQAIAMKSALKKANHPYEWMELKNEGHGYNSEKNKQNIYTKILAFLDKNIGSKSK